MAKKKSVKAGAKIKMFRQRMIVTALVFLVLYIGAQVISRTDGVRKAVADKISNGTRLPASLDHCGATPLLGLRLTGLALPGVELPDVKVSFNWVSFLSKDKPFVRKLSLRDAQVRFRRVPQTGAWEPLVLHGVGSRLGAVVGLNPVQLPEEIDRLIFPSYAINAKTRLQLKRTRVAWLDEQGRELAYILDGDLKGSEAGFMGRRAMQTIVECGQVRLASGQVLDDFRLEAFHIQGSEWITVLEMSDSQGEYPEFSSPTLWQDLSLHLNRLSAVE
jgi:hypothetical protein